jgi:hypothetical protein
VFTDYKAVTNSLNPAVNVPCQVEVPIKTTPPPKGGGLASKKILPTSVRRLREKHLPRRK